MLQLPPKKGSIDLVEMTCMWSTVSSISSTASRQFTVAWAFCLDLHGPLEGGNLSCGINFSHLRLTHLQVFTRAPMMRASLGVSVASSIPRHYYKNRAGLGLPELNKPISFPKHPCPPFPLHPPLSSLWNVTLNSLELQIKKLCAV
jgi:hypothetical protein